MSKELDRTVVCPDNGERVRVVYEGRYNNEGDGACIYVRTSDDYRTGASAYLTVANAKELRKLLKKAIVLAEG